MAKYEVIKDHYVREFGIDLLMGDTFEDGDLEPDVIAQLLAAGIVENPDRAVDKSPAKKRK
jgi:hypothetical protein